MAQVERSFNTQPPEGGWDFARVCVRNIARFNTQPPEGGWCVCVLDHVADGCFNTQPPEGGWEVTRQEMFPDDWVSTHSRLKAAGEPITSDWGMTGVSTHSRLKAAGYNQFRKDLIRAVSTHSRLKAAGGHIHSSAMKPKSFNTQPPEGGWDRNHPTIVTEYMVSTHSRLKAAGRLIRSSTAAIPARFQHTAA